MCNPIINYDGDVNDEDEKGNDDFYKEEDDSVVTGFDKGFVGLILSPYCSRLCHRRQPHHHLYH